MAAGSMKLKPTNITRNQLLEVLKKIKARREAQTSHGKKARTAKKQAKKSSSTGRKKRTTHGISDPEYVEEISSEPTPPPVPRDRIKYKGPYRYLLKEKARKRREKGKPVEDMEEFIRRFVSKHPYQTRRLDKKEKKAKRRRDERKRLKELQRQILQSTTYPFPGSRYNPLEVE